MGSREVPVYLQIEPEFWSYGGEQKVRGARLARATQRRPSAQKGGTLLVKVTLKIPDEAFLPLEPQAVIEIPPNMAEAKLIEVQADDPRAESGGSD